jgi:hypothetical protein
MAVPSAGTKIVLQVGAVSYPENGDLIMAIRARTGTRRARGDPCYHRFEAFPAKNGLRPLTRSPITHAKVHRRDD